MMLDSGLLFWGHPHTHHDEADLANRACLTGLGGNAALCWAALSLRVCELLPVRVRHSWKMHQQQTHNLACVRGTTSAKAHEEGMRLISRESRCKGLFRSESTISTGRQNQWRRIHRARGHVPNKFTNSWTRGTVNRRTANNKLTELYCPSPKRSSKRISVLV